MSAHAKTPATTSPVVTLVPMGPGGKVVGSGNDHSDFYAIIVALLLIVLCIMAVRWLFRRHGSQVTGER